MILVQNTAFEAGDELTKFCERNSTSGAITSFIGQVRNFLKDGQEAARPVNSLILEHYAGMTEKELEAIEKQALERWPIDDILIIHRYGELGPGDPIVFVATAADHRTDAFESCQFLMDWLKIKAPFWKKEITDAGTEWVYARDKDNRLAKRWEGS